MWSLHWEYVAIAHQLWLLLYENDMLIYNTLSVISLNKGLHGIYLHKTLQFDAEESYAA